MSKHLIMLSIILLPLIANADITSQTDWSGGPGNPGPCYEFGNEFFIETDILYADSITLGHCMHLVEGEYDYAYSVHSKDVDGDGDMDVLSAGVYDDNVIWFENSDAMPGILWTQHLIAGDFYCAMSVYSEDIDGDEDIDVLGAAKWDDEITWWENDDGTGTSWTEHQVDTDFDGAYSVYSDDIDGDGDKDILGAADHENAITWWENDDGIGTSWTEHPVDTDFNGACSVYSEDIDGDGDRDILGAAMNDYDITWWENYDGIGTSWVEHPIDSDFYIARSVYSEDIDGDGDMDVLGAAAGDDEITWWENDDGTGTSWTEHQVDTDFDGAKSVLAEDVDGDGDMDVLGAASMDEYNITWWENDGGIGTSWIKYPVDNDLDAANSVYSMDVDNDGVMEILGSGSIASKASISWWDISFSKNGMLESTILYTPSPGLPDWETINWVSDEPSGTTVAFQVRVSNHSSAMGAWSDTLYSPCSLNGILEDYKYYLQYRVILSTADSTITPSLNEVIFTWNPLGIEDNKEPEQFGLLPIHPNPSSGTTVLQVTVPEPMSVSIYLHDLSGRLVFRQANEEYSTGFHSITLDDLSTGIYFCKAVSGDQEDMQRFVVVE